jgi:predicted secreted acid phosphatase
MNAIIVDLDGTLCNSQHVSGFTDYNGIVNWDAWVEATAHASVNEWCRDIVQSFANDGYMILFLTARAGTEQHRKITEDWLKNYGLGHIQYELIMRGKMDRRPDYIVKEEIYNSQIAPYHQVSFALDDKKAICDMWRKIGVPALHCADY